MHAGSRLNDQELLHDIRRTAKSTIVSSRLPWTCIVAAHPSALTRKGFCSTTRQLPARSASLLHARSSMQASIMLSNKCSPGFVIVVDWLQESQGEEKAGVDSCFMLKCHCNHCSQLCNVVMTARTVGLCSSLLSFKFYPLVYSCLVEKHPLVPGELLRCSREDDGFWRRWLCILPKHVMTNRGGNVFLWTWVDCRWS